MFCKKHWAISVTAQLWNLIEQTTFQQKRNSRKYIATIHLEAFSEWTDMMKCSNLCKQIRSESNLMLRWTEQSRSFVLVNFIFKAFELTSLMTFLFPVRAKVFSQWKMFSQQPRLPKIKRRKHCLNIKSKREKQYFKRKQFWSLCLSISTNEQFEQKLGHLKKKPEKSGNVSRGRRSKRKLEQLFIANLLNGLFFIYRWVVKETIRKQKQGRKDISQLFSQNKITSNDSYKKTWIWPNQN